MTAVLPVAVVVGDEPTPPGFPPDSRRRCPTTQRYYLDDETALPGIKSPMLDYAAAAAGDCPSPLDSSAPSSIPASPEFMPATTDHYPYTPTTLSSLSLNASHDGHDDDGDDDDNEEDPSDDGIVLPAFDSSQSTPKQEGIHDTEDLSSDPSVDGSSDPARGPVLHQPAADDTSIEAEPSRHVDYLSHEWKEEDIWTSWRYVVARRHVYSNGVRLENASWRSWAKSKYRLGTISPETLNWMKDCDVTWLYGPLKASTTRLTASNSPPPSRLETPGSMGDRKPILKKKTASETILQRSLTQHTLLKHAGAILQAQSAENPRSRPGFARSTSDFVCTTTVEATPASSTRSTTTRALSSGMISPSEKRHIHFNNEVVQCIAVEAKDVDEDEEDFWATPIDEGSSSDDSLIVMHQNLCSSSSSKGSTTSSHSTPRGSFSSESKTTIAPLPPTTLKYRSDTPDPPPPPPPAVSTTTSRWSFLPRPSNLSPTPSVETIRPPTPQANFLLDDDEEFDDGLWQPQPTPSGGEQGAGSRNRPWFVNLQQQNEEEDDELDEERRLHLTSSGMFMPYEDGESTNNTIFGRVIDTVNTARDIAHVIWNVGWRR